MAREDRKGKRKMREAATRRVPDLGYYIVVTDAKKPKKTTFMDFETHFPENYKEEL